MGTANIRELTNEELMERHARGESGAFYVLYRRTYPVLQRYLRRLAGDSSAAEDLAQASLFRAHLARDKYVAGRPVTPWLLSIARNIYIDDLRRRQRNPACLARTAVLPERAELPAPPRSESAVALIEELPEIYAVAVHLTAIEGYTHDEVASMLNTTRGAVKLRVHRGYKMLRKLLTKEPTPLLRAAAA